MELLNEIPLDVIDGRMGGRPRTPLRQALEAMGPGDILQTDFPATKGQANKVRVMCSSLDSPYEFSVSQSRELNAVIVMCKYEMGELEMDEGVNDE